MIYTIFSCITFFVFSPTLPPVALVCGDLTPTQRREQILGILSTVSEPGSIETAGSPQQNAFDWIVDKDSAQLCPQNENDLIQRYTLAVFYYSTNGDDWKECNAPSDFDSQASIAAANSACTLTTVNATTIFPNDVRGTKAWLTPESECTWGGVSCYSSGTNEGRVNVIEFENNDLSGLLPSEMEQLNAIRFFALERGNISGPIPSSYGNLRSLLLLDFDFNQLTGTISDSLWDLTNLRQLDLNDNQLEGTLSEDINNLSQLRFFQIDNNNLEGAIPASLGDIPNFSEYLSYDLSYRKGYTHTYPLFVSPNI